jgi:hypothetical protein
MRSIVRSAAIGSIGTLSFISCQMGRMIVRSGDDVESTGYRSFGLQAFAA